MKLLSPTSSILGALLLTLSVAAQDAATVQAPVTVENSSTHPALSPPVFPDFVKSSFHLTMKDGTRLATDLFLPANGETAVETPVPLVFVYTRFNRASQVGNQVADILVYSVLRELVRRGYAVAAVDVRGSGASFGRFEGPYSPAEVRDCGEVMDWFAAQSWCDGNLGMFGGSYLGAVQLFAATIGSPHLKAIVPSSAVGDPYAFSWAGGIYRDDYMAQWEKLTKRLDTERIVLPVEGEEGETLPAILAAHAKNIDTAEQYARLPFRDGVDPELEIPLYLATSALSHCEEISRAPTAIYHQAGWLDCYTRDALILYSNLKNPQRITIGPWFHQERHEFDILGEHLRWYDYWLKGIDNGIMDEPPIHYYVRGAKKGERWRTADRWPVVDEPGRLFFVAGPAGTRHGTLAATPPAPDTLSYVADYTTSSGTANRWRNGYGGATGYEDLAPNDARGITFSTAPLKATHEVVGHPVVTLRVDSTATDGDFFVYLEEVEPDGFSRYVTEGCLRASHRATAKPPYEYLGLPWHRSYAEDVEALEPGVPVTLKIDLQPTAFAFYAGNRIRVTITCADADNSATPVLDPAPTVQVHLGGEAGSFVELPFLAKN